jgi:hypothetical protein
MKTKTILSSLGLASLLLTANLASAQFKSHGGGSSSSSSSGSGDNAFTAGADVGYNSFFSDGGSSMSLGLNAEYDMAKFSYRFSFNYWFGTTQTFQTTGIAFSSLTTPETINITETDKVGCMDFGFDVKKTFGSAGPAQGGFYLFAGAGYLIASASSTFSNYDATLYAGPSGGSSASASQLYIRLGLGYDFKIGEKGLAFAEFGLPLAANSVNGQTVDVALPSFYYLHAGYRIVFGR